MRRFLTGPAAILTVVFLIAGCTSSDDTADESTTAPPATTVALAATVAATATTTSEVTSTTEGVSAEVEEEINALIDAWLAAWNESDGQAGVDLFTDDGTCTGFARLRASRPLTECRAKY
jgi:hypothetical protein